MSRYPDNIKKMLYHVGHSHFSGICFEEQKVLTAADQENAHIIQITVHGLAEALKDAYEYGANEGHSNKKD